MLYLVIQKLLEMQILQSINGICFDESEIFSHVRKEVNFNHTTLARNVIIFGPDMSFSKLANNKANNIYVMGKDYIKKN